MIEALYVYFRDVLPSSNHRYFTFLGTEVELSDEFLSKHHYLASSPTTVTGSEEKVTTKKGLSLLKHL